MLKAVFVAVGALCVAVAVAGMFLPLVPTTPLLLLALWCFARSSPRLERWVLGNRLFGRYLDDFYNGRGVPRCVKAYTLALMWAAMAVSAVWATDRWWVRLLLLVVAVGVSVHILSLKTKK